MRAEPSGRPHAIVRAMVKRPHPTDGDAAWSLQTQRRSLLLSEPACLRSVCLPVPLLLRGLCPEWAIQAPVWLGCFMRLGIGSVILVATHSLTTGALFRCVHDPHAFGSKTRQLSGSVKERSRTENALRCSVRDLESCTRLTAHGAVWVRTHPWSPSSD